MVSLLAVVEAAVRDRIVTIKGESPRAGLAHEPILTLSYLPAMSKMTDANTKAALKKFSCGLVRDYLPTIDDFRN